MLSIAEWTDRALALSSPMKLTSSASFSPSIRISLRLKIHQAQAKNFCRVLDIRVPEIVEAHLFHAVPLDECGELRGQVIGLHPLAQLIYEYKAIVFVVIAVAADLFVQSLRFFHLLKIFFETAHKGKCAHTGFCFS